jgi:hypothetical protein
MLWIFFSPEKSEGFGRVRTRDLGYQRPACQPPNHRSRTEGREDGDLGAVAPQSGVPLSFQTSETHILVRLLWLYFPRNWEFGSALSKLRNSGGVNPPPPRRYTTAAEEWTLGDGKVVRVRNVGDCPGVQIIHGNIPYQRGQSPPTTED